MEKMERLQFYLDPEDNEQLDKLAQKLDVSKASLIREGVKKIIKEKFPLEDDPAYKIIGLIDDLDENNVAEEHDYYLYGKGRPENE